MTRPLSRGSHSVVVLVTLSVVAMGLGIGGVGATPSVGGCQTIDSSGTYTLSSSVTTGTTDACFLITASDVVLDGQNNTVTLTAAGEAVNISSTGSITNVTVRNLAVEGGSNGVVVQAPGDGAVVGVRLANNVVNNTTNAGMTMATTGVDSDVTVAITDNRFDTDGDAIGNLDVGGDGSSVDLSITGNTIVSGGSGIDNPSANDANQTVRMRIAGNDINASSEGIYGFELYGDDSRHTIAVVENTIESRGAEGIQFIEVGGGANQTVDVNVSANDVTADSVGIGNINPGGSETTASVTITDNVVAAGTDGIATTSVGSDVKVANVTIARNDVTASANGISVEPAPATRDSPGRLLVEHNSVHAGESAVVVDSGPVTGVAVHNNVLAGGAYGVENLNTTADTYVNATNNYWNASDGPDSVGPYADPVTGALANGTGSNVTNGSQSSTANVHFDPWLSSATPTPTPTPVEETRTTGPGFGVVVALLALVAVLAMRRVTGR